MIAPVANHWKLGLFVTLLASLAMVVLIVLGATQLNRENIKVVTYFDETVQGLDVGSPLKWRGVPIGAVSGISVAPDRRMVEVQLDVYSDLLTKFGGKMATLADLTPEDPLISRLPPDARVRIVSAGITGLKFIELDIVPGAPEPKVSFPLPPNYVPSAPSVMAGLEMGIAKAVDDLPALLTSINALVDSMQIVVGDVHDAHLTEAMSKVLVTIDEILAGVRAGGANDRISGIASEFEATLKATRDTVAAIGETSRSLTAQLERADPAATGAALRRAADTVTVIGEEFGAPGAGLGAQVAALRETLDRARELLELITRQPDVFLSGRSDEPPPER